MHNKSAENSGCGCAMLQVQCDDCDAWYHTDCAGCTDNLSQLAAAQFHCGCTWLLDCWQYAVRIDQLQRYRWKRLIILVVSINLVSVTAFRIHQLVNNPRNCCRSCFVAGESVKEPVGCDARLPVGGIVQGGMCGRSNVCSFPGQINLGKVSRGKIVRGLFGENVDLVNTRTHTERDRQLLTGYTISSASSAKNCELYPAELLQPAYCIESSSDCHWLRIRISW